MRAHAARVVPHGNGAIDLAPFHAMQQWLTLAGERRISVPFAPVLVDLLPATADRTRRDYRQLLTTIQADAFFQQCQRGRTPEGWVEATVEDYARVRKLLAPNFDTITAEEVTEAVRKTVEAVKEGKELSEMDLVRRLGLSKAVVAHQGGLQAARSYPDEHHPRHRRPHARPQSGRRRRRYWRAAIPCWGVKNRVYAQRASYPAGRTRETSSVPTMQTAVMHSLRSLTRLLGGPPDESPV